MKIWRRSYDIPPPPLDTLTIPVIRASIDAMPACRAAELPASESLKDTLARVLPYWNSRIAPELQAGRNVLVAAHGNSLRALVKMLDDMSDEAIVELNIPTGVPLLYDLDGEPEAAFEPLSRRCRGDQGTCRSRGPAGRGEGVIRRQVRKPPSTASSWPVT